MSDDKKHVEIKRDEEDRDVWWVINRDPDGKVLGTWRCADLVSAQQAAELIVGEDFFDGDFQVGTTEKGIKLKKWNH
jgi:hypothetical protein|tara:strand:+ start:895 stop:1125 length:231 start_codon:yes stop_codon:yes gene_type:complete